MLTTGGSTRQLAGYADNQISGVTDQMRMTSYLIDFFNHTGYAQTLEEQTVTTDYISGVPQTPVNSLTTYLIGDDVIAQTVNDTTQYLLYDGHGSTRQLAYYTGTDVTIADNYSYDGYGVFLQEDYDLNSIAVRTLPQQTSLLYAGEHFDFNSQQYYNRARWYNPLSGRFNRLDPYAGNLHDPQSLHKYLYCHANPINGIDPTGLENLTITMAVQTHQMNMRSVEMTTTLTVTMTAKGSLQALLAMAIFLYSSACIINLIGFAALLKAFKDMEELISPSALTYIKQIHAEAKAAAAVLAAWEAIKQMTKIPPTTKGGYNLPIHFVFEDLTPDIYDNTVNALKSNSRWWILNYFGPNPTRKNMNRRAAQANPGNGDWTARISGKKVSPDEYPYASTEEGGAGAFIKPVTLGEQTEQGIQLSAFYRSRLKGQPGPFLVVPVPKTSW